jgi:hypothetical protein
VNQVLNILTILREAGERTLDLTSCERIVPIYTNTFYTGSCEYSLQAMMWIFACALIIGTSGMLMVTFRAAYKLTDSHALLGSDDGVDTDMNTTAEGDVPGEQRIREVQAPTETADWVDDDAYSVTYRDEKGVEVPLELD